MFKIIVIVTSLITGQPVVSYHGINWYSTMESCQEDLAAHSPEIVIQGIDLALQDKRVPQIPFRVAIDCNDGSDVVTGDPGSVRFPGYPSSDPRNGIKFDLLDPTVEDKSDPFALLGLTLRQMNRMGGFGHLKD